MKVRLAAPCCRIRMTVNIHISIRYCIDRGIDTDTDIDIDYIYIYRYRCRYRYRSGYRYNRDLLIISSHADSQFFSHNVVFGQRFP